MLPRPETLSGVGQNLIDFSTLPGYSCGIPSFSQYVAVDAKTLADIVNPSGSCREQDTRMLTRQLEEGIYVPGLAEAYATDLTPFLTPKKTQLIQDRLRDRLRASVGVVGRGMAAAMLFAASMGMIGPSADAQADSQNKSGKGIQQNLEDIFLTSGKALKQFLNPKDTASATEIGRAPIDTYGPEMTEEELRAANLNITARDYIKDANGNVIKQIIKQIVVLDNNIVYESDDSPQNTFPSFKAISQLPVKISSMISSSDGQITLAGGAIDHINQKTRMFISYDGRKTWKEIIVPADFDGTPADLVRFTNQDFFGTTLTGEGAANQFIARIDPIAQSETIIPVDMQAGALQNLDVTALDTASRTATIVSNRYIQNGLAVSTIDYSTAIGTAQMITQTLLTDGTLINLGYVYGTGVYTDTLGNPRVSTSNTDRNTLYDFNLANPLDGTATKLYYANLCDNKGIPDYMPGYLSILAIDVSIDPQGNKKTRFGGSSPSSIDGISRAMFGVIEDGICLLLEHDEISTIARPQDMQKMRINNEWGYELGIRNLGKAFVDGNFNIYYTDRGLGSPLILPTPTPTPTPSTYPIFLPNIFR